MNTSMESDEDFAARVVNFGLGDTDLHDQKCDEDVDITGLMSDGTDADTEPAARSAGLDGAGVADHRTHRFDHKVAWRFGGLATAGVAATLAAAVVLYSHDSGPVAPSGVSLGEPAAVAVATPAPPPSGSVAPGVDRPLPYIADAQGSCAPGSTPAQTMSGSDPRNAFTCVRGGGDGQTISIDLGRTYVITAISITPGWAGQDASGVSQWSQHRVVTLVQYMFDNDPTSLVTQDTKNVHGEAVQPIKHQLASKIQVLIRQTSRPPTQPPQQEATQAPGGGGLTLIFGDNAPSSPTAPSVTPDPLTGQVTETNSDPVDASFAISNLKIIGHEAV